MVANRSAALRRTSAFAALLAFEGGAVVVLHRLGELSWLRVPLGDLGPWLQAASPEDVIAAVARLVALAAAWWLLGSTTLYVLARLTRIPGAIRAVGWVTLPAVRRLADQALALTLATSLVSGGANAALAGPAVFGPSRAGPGRWGAAAAQAGTPSTTAPPPAYTPQPAGPPGAPTPGPGTGPGQPGPQAPPSRPDVHRVRPGDNLWVIARDRLAQVTGRDAGTVPEREVARYWLAVIEANQAGLRSGDPDLIYPGELIRLPPMNGLEP